MVKKYYRLNAVSSVSNPSLPVILPDGCSLFQLVFTNKKQALKYCREVEKRNGWDRGTIEIEELKKKEV